MIRARLERWAENIVAAYLMQQVNTGPRGPDSYGQTKRLQKDCTIFQIAFFVKKEPYQMRAILERLHAQMRAEPRGQLWAASDYQMRQRIGRLVRLRLYFLWRSYHSRLSKESKAGLPR